MRIVIAAVLASPTALFAAGGDNAPPSNPTAFCTGGKIYDKQVGKCVEPKESNRDTLYEAIRQLAYAGRYNTARKLLSEMPINDPGRLTYMGFVSRKLGQRDTAFGYYQKAIELDTDNTWARSYMGQGFVELGQIELAKEQLTEIRTRGGTGTWPEISLADSIETGRTYRH